MGLLIEGKWHDHWYDTKKSGGRFERQDAPYRNWITPDGAAGPTGGDGFAAEPGRYHLYVAYACPWAQRTLIFRTLKGLGDMIGVSFVHWYMGENGWSFAPDPDGVVGDRLGRLNYLFEVYLKANPTYSGRVTVPVLWDTRRETIVNNESSEIIRMFNSAFDHIGAKHGDYYPVALRPSIDSLNERIYDTVNNGVYRAGFSTSQEAYEEAVVPLFQTLDMLEERLGHGRWLFGNVLTEADWRLFTTLLRFDAIYYAHFKCNRCRLADYPNLWGFTRDLYQMPGIAETFDFQHAKRHYYQSQRTVNPTGIVPVGPTIDFDAPSGRAL